MKKLRWIAETYGLHVEKAVQAASKRPKRTHS